MKYFLNLISLIIFTLFYVFQSSASNFNKIDSKILNYDHVKILKIESKIGVVDFRNILKKSLTMQKLGREFLKFEKNLNDKIENKELILRNREKKLSIEKKNLTSDQYNKRKNKIKKEITKLQKYAFTEKKDLNSSFQLIQKKLQDVLILEPKFDDAKREELSQLDKRRDE